MRFVSFLHDDQPVLALRDGEGARLLGPVHLDDVLAAGEGALKSLADKATDANLIEVPDALLPPLKRPSKILCVGLNYRDHTAEAQMEQPDYPTVFARFSSGLIGHGQPIVCPTISEQLDFEGEMAVVIGRPTYQATRASALEHVAGYSIFNDGSVRDYQKRTTQWTVGKNFDGTGAFGPDFVTADELPWGGAGLRLETRLNGRVMQAANTSDMIFDVVDLVVTLSAAMTLEPGDIIVSGTPAGVGAARKPPVYMQDGDTCEISIEGIGVLRNPVIKQT